jgi:Tol biopolymer transport system component
LIHVVDADGGTDREVTRGIRIAPAAYNQAPLFGGLKWSPDSSRIAISVLQTDPDSTDASLHPKVLIAQTDEGGIHPLGLPADLDAMDVEWSPDGDQIAFKGQIRGKLDTGIWVANADGSNPLRLDAREICEAKCLGSGPDRTLTTELGLMETYAFSAPRWSPDGRFLMTYCCVDGEHDVWLIDAANGRLYQISFDPRDEYWPAWSPDGTMIVYQRTPTEGASPDIGSETVLVGTDDVQPIPDVDLPDTSAAGTIGWAPDGSAVLGMAGPVWMDQSRPAIMSLDSSVEPVPIGEPRPFGDWTVMSWQPIP